MLDGYCHNYEMYLKSRATATKILNWINHKYGGISKKNLMSTALEVFLYWYSKSWMPTFKPHHICQMYVLTEILESSLFFYALFFMHECKLVLFC
jgi:hypothetical protein